MTFIGDAVSERDEVEQNPPLCPCDKGYVGHADNDDQGYRCYYDPRGPNVVDKLEFVWSRPQWYRDSWRNVQRQCVFTGACIVCGRRCYEFIDGQNDPRGPLGEHADSGFHAEEIEDVRRGEMFSDALPDVAACFPCMNEEWSYKAGLAAAIRIWRRLD